MVRMATRKNRTDDGMAAKPEKSRARKPAASSPAHKHSAKTAETAKHSAATHQDIALLAYSFWQERGYAGGSPEDDWLRAESQLTGTPGR